jgi:hypothetical protein
VRQGEIDFGSDALSFKQAEQTPAELAATQLAATMAPVLDDFVHFGEDQNNSASVKPKVLKE